MCTEQCGVLTPPDEQQLIESFRSIAAEVFAFLVEDHDLRPSEVATYNVDDGSRIPADAAEVGYPFLVVAEFTGNNRPVRLSYGRRDYGLDLEIGANGSGFHPLESWLDALGMPQEPAEDTGLATPPALAHHTARIGRLLEDHFEAISRAGHDVIDRLPSLGAKTAPRLNRTRDKAHSAFAEGDYGSYIELLGPFEAALTVTERRKLDFARARR